MTDPSNVFQTRAQGKFLLTGEYAVLDGAQALAIPLHFGQTLSANTSETPGLLQWTALEADGSPWLSTSIRLDDLSIATASDEAPARTVRDLLLACRRQRPEFLVQATGLELQTQTDFPRPWGLGTSSTLIAALALWSGADPYRLLAETLGGSGYDIACAYAASPLLFQLKKEVPRYSSWITNPTLPGNSILFTWVKSKTVAKVFGDTGKFRATKAISSTPCRNSPPCGWKQPHWRNWKRSLNDAKSCCRAHLNCLEPRICTSPITGAP
ncbi:MAG: hypothetical protein IPL65_15880 [Lewinellaceae bacterium]|nr:hypothetical protein [Lewinellaceae bacterium]